MQQIFQWVDRKIQHRNTALIILGIITAAVFINILSNSFFMDDFDFVVGWDLIKDIRNLPRFFVGYIYPEGQDGVYSPLRTLFFALNYMMFHENPMGWHVVSIIIHFLGVWGVYCLTQVLTGRRWLSFLSAFLFAVHPVHAEPIASITGSIDMIGVVFGFWAFYWYIRAVLPADKGPVFAEDGALYNSETSAQRDVVDKRFYWRSVALGVAAMFTHELVLTLPILLFMFDAFFLHPRFSWKRALMRVLPFFGVAVAYVFLKGAILGGISRGGYAFGDPYRTFLIIIKSWAQYFGVLLVPVLLTHNKCISNGIMSYNQDDFDRAAFFAQSWHDPQVLLSFVVLLGVFLAGVFFYRKKPLISFCIFWFYVSLAPVSQIVPSTVYYGERYLYPGSWAYCLIFAWLFLMIYKKCLKVYAYKILCIGIMIAIGTGYAVRTTIKNRDFHDQIRGYEQAVKNNPQSAYLKKDLGVLLGREGDFTKSKEYLSQALKIQPNNDDFYFSLAETYAMFAHDKKAIQSLEKTIELNPDFAEAYFNLAVAVTAGGDEKLGVRYLEQAVNLWKKQGKTFEAGEAVNAFYMFLADQKGLLQKRIQEDFT